eukprot:CAMPEP_0197490684 /NCGR_PEP_ID=MMETSP1311-20131121/5161_1 /TAXON_ID=464262 /ORGANISM="Genus nov. species nov., Strain RCC856" /LENGTH=56 /DNA_ID=CAMNT_0043035243 /DNA_START=338 /DNA_END=508 /DNA_ORIENTATION=-
MPDHPARRRVVEGRVGLLEVHPLLNEKLALVVEDHHVRAPAPVRSEASPTPSPATQ